MVASCFLVILAGLSLPEVSASSLTAIYNGAEMKVIEDTLPYPRRRVKNKKGTNADTEEHGDNPKGNLQGNGDMQPEALVELALNSSLQAVINSVPSSNETEPTTIEGIVHPVGSRHWKNIVSSESMPLANDNDNLRRIGAEERDAFFFTDAPSSVPSEAPSTSYSPSKLTSKLPSSLPSEAPSLSPSDVPSKLSSEFPSTHSSSHPTSLPSQVRSENPTALPSEEPTFAPTTNPFVPNPAPSRPPNSYFDYRTSSNAKRGVENWDRVDDPPEGDYWGKLSQWIDPGLGNSRCDSKSPKQSPIDVSFEDSKGYCLEYHQIRHKRGEFDILDDKVDIEILPSKLRVVYPREWDYGSSGNDEIRGPSADMPKGWGHQLPVTHVDIKMPSEHTLEGKRYAAEYQIWLIQNSDRLRGAPAISILFDFHPEDKPNEKIQELLDVFQIEWDKDMADCEDRRRKERRLGATAQKSLSADGEGRDKGVSTWLDEPEEEEVKFQSKLSNLRKRALRRLPWNVFDDEIMRSIWFYGYSGSLTEPPCTEFVEWRIIDTPGLISRAQLWQMKNLLFGHVDKKCKKTSVHYDNSVARPLQPHRGRNVHRCMCRDFIADNMRDKYRNNRCDWDERDEFGFPKDQYTTEWYRDTHD